MKKIKTSKGVMCAFCRQRFYGASKWAGLKKHIYRKHSGKRGIKLVKTYRVMRSGELYSK